MHVNLAEILPALARSQQNVMVALEKPFFRLRDKQIIEIDTWYMTYSLLLAVPSGLRKLY